MGFYVLFHELKMKEQRESMGETNETQNGGHTGNAIVCGKSHALGHIEVNMKSQHIKIE